MRSAVFHVDRNHDIGRSRINHPSFASLMADLPIPVWKQDHVAADKIHGVSVISDRRLAGRDDRGNVAMVNELVHQMIELGSLKVATFGELNLDEWAVRRFKHAPRDVRLVAAGHDLIVALKAQSTRLPGVPEDDRTGQDNSDGADDGRTAFVGQEPSEQRRTDRRRGKVGGDQAESSSEGFHERMVA